VDSVRILPLIRLQEQRLLLLTEALNEGVEPAELAERIPYFLTCDECPACLNAAASLALATDAPELVTEDTAEDTAENPEIEKHPVMYRVPAAVENDSEQYRLQCLLDAQLASLEEHAALEQRHQFLAEQLADLKRSRDDLLSIVEEIDARVQEVFAQAYEDTARQFASVFDRLFPGGEGRLVLTDPDDMLTTGIEIEARPAGKKVKRLSLLSGGERSLAAVALLVAIFKARPSPFYVMDEVEAALDDTNLGRLLEIFTELRRSSQLIIITHQKRTMEVADALYGITMRDGVTKAVSQRLAQPDRGTAVTPDV